VGPRAVLDAVVKRKNRVMVRRKWQYLIPEEQSHGVEEMPLPNSRRTESWFGGYFTT
jgi:hypothetical protein